MSEGEKPPIAELLEYYSGKAHVDTGSGWRPTICVIHDDTRPSASYNSEYQALHCFTCGWSGDSWSLIMEKEDCDFASAKSRASEILGRSFDESASGAPVKRQRIRILDRGAGSQSRNPESVHDRRRPRKRPRLS